MYHSFRAFSYTGAVCFFSSVLGEGSAQAQNLSYDVSDLMQQDLSEPAQAIEGILEADGNTFDALVRQSQRPVVVMFETPWCPHCRVAAAKLEKWAVHKPDVRVVRVNIEENPGLAKIYQVHQIPTFYAFDHGVGKRVTNPERAYKTEG